MTPDSHIQLFNPTVVGVRLNDDPHTRAGLNEDLCERFKQERSQQSRSSNGTPGQLGIQTLWNVNFYFTKRTRQIFFEPWLWFWTPTSDTDASTTVHRCNFITFFSSSRFMHTIQHPWNEFHFQQTIKWPNELHQKHITTVSYTIYWPRRWSNLLLMLTSTPTSLRHTVMATRSDVILWIWSFPQHWTKKRTKRMIHSSIYEQDYILTRTATATLQSAPPSEM